VDPCPFQPTGRTSYPAARPSMCVEMRMHTCQRYCPRRCRSSEPRCWPAPREAGEVAPLNHANWGAQLRMRTRAETPDAWLIPFQRAQIATGPLRDPLSRGTPKQ
jgi:hypothetical protein